MAAEQHDWGRIKTDWLAENLDPERLAPFTLKHLAERWKVSYQYIRTVAGRENWRDDLKRLRTERVDEAQEHVKRLSAIDEAEIRVRQTKVARALAGIAASRLAQLAPEELTKREAIDLYEKATKAEREAAGLPRTSRIEIEEAEAGSPAERMEKSKKLKKIAERLEELLGDDVSKHVPQGSTEPDDAGEDIIIN